jgi:hypothetical protein
MEVSGQLHAQPLYSQGRSPWLDGPQSQSGHGDEEKNSQPLPGLEPPIIQPIAQHCANEQSLLQRKVHRLGMFENRTPRRIFGLKRETVTGG